MPVKPHEVDYIMIWAGSIGFLGVSSMIFGAIARSAGHNFLPERLTQGGDPAPCARPPSQKTSVTSDALRPQLRGVQP